MKQHRSRFRRRGSQLVAIAALALLTLHPAAAAPFKDLIKKKAEQVQDAVLDRIAEDPDEEEQAPESPQQQQPQPTTGEPQPVETEPTPSTGPGTAPTSQGSTEQSPSLVAPAPAGAATAPAPEAAAPTATPSSATSAPPSATSAAAAQAGLRVVRGRPLLIFEGWTGVIESEGIATAADVAAMDRFLDYIRIGLNPDIARASSPGAGRQAHHMDSRARCVANRILAPDARGEVLQPQVDPMSGDKQFRAWKGAPDFRGAGGNEFELQRAKERFNELLPGLVAEAPRLPMKFVLIDQVLLRTYDQDQGGFPFTPPDLTLRKSACLGIDSDYLPVATKLPSLLAMSPEAGEALIQRIPVNAGSSRPERKAFIAVELTLSAAPENPLRGKLTDETLVPMKIDIDSVALYEDPDLERQLHSFNVDAPAPAVLLAGLPERIPVADPVMLNEETVALLVLKSHGDVLSPEAWNLLARLHSDSDGHYYAKEQRRDYIVMTQTTRLDAYDPDYVPFFPPGVTLTHGRTLTSDQLSRFKAWMLARAEALPERFMLQGQVVRVDGGNGPDRAELQFERSDSGLQRVLQPLVSRGYNRKQIAIPELDKSQHYLAGPGRRRAAFLVFPNVLDEYLPGLTLDQLTEMSENQRWSWTVEIDVTLERTELAALDQKTATYGSAIGDAVLLHLEPQALRVLRPVRVEGVPTHRTRGRGRDAHPSSDTWRFETLHQQSYDVKPLAIGQNTEWDVLGIRLGMSMAEAEAIVRREVEVASVYDRVKQKAALGHGYALSRVFIGTDREEVIALFAAAGDPDRVLAVFRRTRMNRGDSVASGGLYTDKDPIYRALTAKYGPEPRRTTYYLSWGSAAGLSPCAGFRASDLGPSESTFRAGTAGTMDRGLLAQVDFGLDTKVEVAGGGTKRHRPASDWSSCGPVVVAHGWGEPMRLWLFDHSLAVPHAEREYRAYAEGIARQSETVEADLRL